MTQPNGPNVQETTAPQIEFPELLELSPYLEDRDTPLSQEETNERRRLLRRLLGRESRVDSLTHDLYFYINFSDVRLVEEAIEIYAPNVAKVVDLKRLKRESTTRVNRMFGRKIADQMFSAPSLDPRFGDLRVFIVIEHKAQGSLRDRRRSFANLLQYAALATFEPMNDEEAASDEETGREDESSRPRPQTITLVFYAGEDEDFELGSFEELFPALAGLEEFAIRFKPICINLTRAYSEGKIKGSPYLRAAFTALALTGKRTIAERFRDVIKIFAEIKGRSERKLFFLNAFIEYAFASAKKIGQTISHKTYYDAISELEDLEMKDETFEYCAWISKEEQEECFENGFEKGIEKGLKGLWNLVSQGLLSVDQAANAIGLTVPQFEAKASALAATNA